MPITRVEVTPLRDAGESKTKALATVVWDDRFAAGPFRVVEGEKGLFVGSPRRKDKADRWHDIVRPLTSEARQEMSQAVLDAYHRAVERGRDQDRGTSGRER